MHWFNLRAKKNDHEAPVLAYAHIHTEFLAVAAGKSRVDLRLLGFMGPLTRGAPWAALSTNCRVQTLF